jgi:hypothetical protein
MASTVTATRMGGGDQHNKRGYFGNTGVHTEGGGIGPNGCGFHSRVGPGGNPNGNVVRGSKMGLAERERRELSGDEIEVDEEPAINNKRIKVTEETVEVPAAFFGQIVGMLESFQTKGTIWYDSPEAEKKRDKTAFVLWKGRTRPDGTMTLSTMDQTRTVREVIATEVSIAQQFKNIFDPNSASRIFELVGGGSNIQKAVFQALNEQEGSGSD